MHNARISKALKSRRSRGLPKSGKPVKRLKYPEMTLTDYRIKSDMTLEEVWGKLHKRADKIVDESERKLAYAPQHFTSIIWTEKNGTEKANTIRAFAEIYGVDFEMIEAALKVPIRYKNAGCTSVESRWDKAREQKWTITYQRTD